MDVSIEILLFVFSFVLMFVYVSSYALKYYDKKRSQLFRSFSLIEAGRRFYYILSLQSTADHEDIERFLEYYISEMSFTCQYVRSEGFNVTEEDLDSFSNQEPLHAPFIQNYIVDELKDQLNSKEHYKATINAGQQTIFNYYDIWPLSRERVLYRFFTKLLEGKVNATNISVRP